MAAFDFPNSPSTNQTYTANGVTFQWNGSVWTRYSASQGAQGSTGAQGAQGAVGSPGAQGATGAQGAQGHQGAVGAQGTAGAQGAQGHQGTAGSNASISNNANNRVITGGSGTNLVGESDLTYDGSSLDIFDSSNSQSVIKLKRHASTASQQAHIGYFSSGLHIETREETFISLKTNTNERLRIDSAGRIQIGSSTNTSYNTFDGPGRLNIQNNSADGTVDFSQGIVFTDNTNNSGTWTHAGIVCTGSSGYRGNIVFGTDDNGTSDNLATNITERIRIDSSGRLLVNTTSGHGQFQVHDGTIVHSKPSGGGTRNYRFVNNNTAAGDYGIQISSASGGSTYVNHTELKAGGDVHIHDGNLVVASGHGIDFSATSNSSGTMTSELLDNYEEGTWTPTIYRSNNSGVSGSYNHQEGSYVRIGRLVYALFRVDIASFSGGSGHTAMGGLPFTTHAHGVGGWTYVANMSRMYLNGDYAGGVDATSIRFAGGINYGYIMNIDDDQWDYNNYSRILFEGYVTYQTS